MDKQYKCGWCITEDCGGCREVIVYEGKEHRCACTHEARRPIPQSEWLGYSKYHTDEEGMP